MDEELRDAALNGDVEFLKKCVESNKPVEYYMTYNPQSVDDKDDRFHGNIFHTGAYNNREEFIREAIQILPPENTKMLLLQPREPVNGNPLHVAAMVGNIEIVKMFLDVYRCLPTLPSDHLKRPWLLKTDEGYSPCSIAMYYKHEDCALEIYEMDAELISNMPNQDSGASLVFEAVQNKMSKLAIQLLRSPFPVSCSGIDGYTPLHAINFIQGSEEANEVFQRLLQRAPELIKQVNEAGYSAIHTWASDGKLWPFKCLIENHDLIPEFNEIFTNLISSTNINGENPLHILALNAPVEEAAIEIAKLLIDFYKDNSSSNSSNALPWLAQDNEEVTPLSSAIERGFEDFALYILSVDENAVHKNFDDVLFMSIEWKCYRVAEKILEIIDNKGWTQLLTNDKQQTILHLAPSCTSEFGKRLIEKHPELLRVIDKGGVTILHTWMLLGELWLFEFVLDSKWRAYLVKHIDAMDYNLRINPFHTAAATSNEATYDVVKLLVKTYKEEKLNWQSNSIGLLPWFEKDKAGHGPLHYAIHALRENLALYILSLFEGDHINELLDYYNPEQSVLFLTMEANCFQVAEKILSRLDKKNRTKYLRDAFTGENILHLALTLKDEKFGNWLVNKAPKFITKEDNDGLSPWDKAYEIGPAWFIKAVLKKDPSIFNKAPLAWIKACEHGHVSALRAFIDHNPGAFRDLCILKKETPLHHLKLSSLTEYEDFLTIPRMKDLINVQNSQGATPLHLAIQNRKIALTETLLSMEKTLYNIIDKDNKTAIELLAEACEKDDGWEEMCLRIGFDPWINTSYFQRKTNLLEVRNSLFVVAALLATITFTAGFTLPGGLNQDNGQALLAKSVAFLVFLMSNTLAMCSSMLVLICLVWSMVQDSSKSLLLIDRSMWLLMVAFYSTLLAFMTGVYIVISPKVLWAAIVIIVMCSLIGISANTTLLYKVLFISSRKKNVSKDSLRQLEQGISMDEKNPLLNHNEEMSTQRSQTACQANEDSNGEENSADDDDSDNDSSNEDSNNK